LNTASSDEVDVTSFGRPFHTFAPVTGKVRPLTVDRRQVGTSRPFGGGGPEPASVRYVGDTVCAVH